MRRSQRSCRTALLWGVGAFLALQVGFGLALERWWTRLRDPEYAVKLGSLRARLAGRGPGRPLVVLLGSSRVGVNVRPQDLLPWPGPPAGAPLVFNAALCRSDPVLEYLMLRRLLAEGIRPDWLLVEVTPECFNDVSHPPDTVQPHRLRRGECRWVRPYFADPAVLDRAWREVRLCPAYGYRFTTWACLAPSLLPPDLAFFASDWRGLDGEGWLNMPRFRDLGDPVYHTNLLAMVRGTFASGFQHFRPRPASDRALHALLAYCRRKHIRVVLMRMPDLFRGDYAPAARTEIAEYVRGIARAYKTPVADMRAWAADTDFYDGVHLTHPGVRAFTQRFGRKLLWPLLTRLTGPS